MSEPLIVARSGSEDLALLPAMANRHGCITGATGTGKTISLQVLAERFSRIGVPVFLADVKGDLTGISKARSTSPTRCSDSWATASDTRCVRSARGTRRR